MSGLADRLRHLHVTGHAAVADLHDESGYFTQPYRPAAVLVAVTERERPGFLFIHRPSNMRAHPGQVAFPGGKIDGTESAVEAALREAWEELGIRERDVTIIGESDVYHSGSGYAITPVLAVVQPGFELVPNPAEVEKVFDVPLSFLMDPRNHERGSGVWLGDERHYYRMPYEGHNIWGITAGIVRVIYERLYA